MTAPAPSRPARPRARSHDRGESGPARAALIVLVAAAGAAGGTHLAVVPEHLEEFWPAAMVLGLIGAAQLGLAVAAVLHRLPTAVLEVAARAQLAVIALYVATRTVPGLPGAEHVEEPPPGGLGPGAAVYPGQGVEEVGSVDTVCLVAELILVAAILVLLPPDRARSVRRLLVPTAGVLVLISTLGLIRPPLP